MMKGASCMDNPRKMLLTALIFSVIICCERSFASSKSIFERHQMYLSTKGVDGSANRLTFIGTFMRSLSSRSSSSSTSTSGQKITSNQGHGQQQPFSQWSKLGGSFLGGLLLLFSKAFPSLASPFQPRPAPANSGKPYFEGWFLRTVDHGNNASFSLIIGSLKTAEASNYTQHYVALSYLDKEGNTQSFHSFPSAESVEILVDGVQVEKIPDSSGDPSFVWRSSEVGELMINKSQGSMSFCLPEIAINATFMNREPWSKDRPNEDGPEGWISKASFLLPCHYFVHSLASPTSYTMKITNGSGELSDKIIHGKGHTHMEANYGDSFPEGWSWAQGVSEDGKIQFILTGGKFVIGPFTTNTWIIGFRSEAYQLNYRTTDCFNSIKANVSCTTKELHLVATSPLHPHITFSIDICVAPEKEFSEPIYVPTKTGFSDCPGCIESYAANAKVRIHEHNTLVEEIHLPHSALEFGGIFQYTTSRENNPV
mmetsp:Transcript_15599/g.19982  ORF Transcript_15599/g.19982 Transcript_15599/m.19982 type:complete len:483 (+) Transcript_15599:73-1521(+)